MFNCLISSQDLYLDSMRTHSIMIASLQRFSSKRCCRAVSQARCPALSLCCIISYLQPMYIHGSVESQAASKYPYFHTIRMQKVVCKVSKYSLGI